MNNPVYTYTYIRTYICIHTYILYIYIYIHTYIHTYINTYIYTVFNLKVYGKLSREYITSDAIYNVSAGMICAAVGKTVAGEGRTGLGHPHHLNQSTVSVYKYIQQYINTYVHSYIHTHTHTHTHTQILPLLSLPIPSIGHTSYQPTNSYALYSAVVCQQMNQIAHF